MTLEANTPSLIHQDDEIWFKLFKQSFPKHYQDLSGTPQSWRQLFLQVESKQSSLLNNAAQRLRSKQQDAQNEKLRRQTMFTTEVPSKRHKTSRNNSSLYQKSMNEAKLSTAGRNARFLKPFKKRSAPNAPQSSMKASDTNNLSSFSSSTPKPVKTPLVSTSFKVIKKPSAQTSSESQRSKDTTVGQCSNTDASASTNVEAQPPIHAPTPSRPSIFLPKKTRR